MEIYDIPQLAEMLRVNKKTVRDYLKDGKLVGRKVGKRWLTCEDALKDFLMNPASDRRKSSGSPVFMPHVESILADFKRFGWSDPNAAMPLDSTEWVRKVCDGKSLMNWSGCRDLNPAPLAPQAK
jgi:excisionase family DNA binding protein